MELGAGVELATAAVPHLFLPLACAANVVKVLPSLFNTHNCCELQSYLFCLATNCLCFCWCFIFLIRYFYVSCIVL